MQRVFDKMRKDIETERTKSLNLEQNVQKERPEKAVLVDAQRLLQRINSESAKLRWRGLRKE